MNEEKFWKKVDGKRSKFLVMLDDGRRGVYNSSLGLRFRTLGGYVCPLIEFEDGSENYVHASQIKKVKILKNYQKS